MKQLSLKPDYIWYASTTKRGLTCCAVALALPCHYFIPSHVLSNLPALKKLFLTDSEMKSLISRNSLMCPIVALADPELKFKLPFLTKPHSPEGLDHYGNFGYTTLF